MFRHRLSKPDRYDICIIGGGESGVSLALAQAKRKRVIIIDQSQFFGGYTKAKAVVASLKTAAKQSPDRALKLAQSTLSDLQAMVDARGRLQSAGVITLDGHAEQLDPETVLVNGKPLKAKQIYVTGSQLIKPSVKMPSKTKVYTTISILDLPKLPKRLAIIGGDGLGLEIASVFQSLNVNVSLLLAPHESVSALEKARLKRAGAAIYGNTKIATIERLQRADRINFIQQSNPSSLVVDAILLNLVWESDKS